MKLKGAKQVHYDSGPNMTPLVDVVMVILIFLMLAGSFGANEHYLLSSVPMRTGGSSNDNSPIPKTTDLKIRVDSGGEGTYTAQIGEASYSTDEDVLAALKGQLQTMQGAGIKVDDIQVIIDPGSEVDYKYRLAVYQAALDAQFTKVAFQQEH